MSGSVLKHRYITAWFDVPSTTTIPSSNSVVDIDSCFVTRDHLILLTTLPLTRQPDCLLTHVVTHENQVACTKYMKQSFKTL